MSKHLDTLHIHKRLLGAHNVNVNQVHKETMSRLDRIALAVTNRLGRFGTFLIIASWTVLWLGWNMLAPAGLRFDPAPAFVLWLFVSNMIQICLMPLIMIGQNLDARHSELRAELDLHINQASFSKLEEHSRVLEEQNTDLLKHSNQLSIIGTAANEVRIGQMQHESLLVSTKSDLDRLTQLVEAVDRRLQQLQKKASGA